MSLETIREKKLDAYIAKEGAKDDQKLRLVLKGEPVHLQVYRVPISYLIYNIRNGRFAAELLAEESKLKHKLDPGAPQDAKVIQKLLLELNPGETEALRADLRRNGQLDPGVITRDGAVINANRRMSILSALHEETQDPQFEYLRVARLPKDVDEKDIWRIEAGLQFAKEFRLNYSPINELLKLKEGRDSGLSSAEISRTLLGRFSLAEVEEKLSILKLIESYLVFIEKPGHYHIVQQEHDVEKFNSLQASVCAPLKRKGMKDAEIANLLTFAFLLINKTDLRHWDIRLLSKIAREPKAYTELLKNYDSKKPLAEPKEKLVESFVTAKEIVEAKEDHDRPERLLRKALSALQGIGSEHPKLTETALKSLLASLKKEMEPAPKGGEGSIIMSRETAHIRLERDSLTIDLEKGSSLLSGVHRIYFVNVLGFESSSDSIGYVMRSSASGPRALADVIEYLQEHQIQPELSDGARMAIKQFQIASEDLTAARNDGRAIKSKPPKAIDVPRLKRALKPYQVPAVAHAMAVRNAANFSVPGSGKTAIVLSVFAILKARKEIEKVVVVGTGSSFLPWEEEFSACFLRKPRSIRISGTRRERMKLYRRAETAELVFLTYQMATNDRDKLSSLLQQKRSLLVLDESHNIKRLDGGTWAPALIDVGVHASRRMILTGTPAPNSAADLWSQMAFLWPNPPALGTRDQFKSRIGQQDPESLEQLRGDLFPLYYRIRKGDLHLPKPRFRRIRLELRPYQRAIYAVLAAKVLSDVVKAPTERARLRVWRTARMVRLLQAASNPALLTQYSTEFQVPPLSAAGLSVDELIHNYHSYETPVKVDFAVKLASELIRDKKKVLIWTAFVHNIRTLEKALQNFNPRVIYGDIPKDGDEDLEFNRERMIHDFRNSPKYPLLIANPSACAESVSLHKACNHAIYLDRTFNAAHYMQSLDRIHRMGMNPSDKVQYYLLLGRDTIDEVIDERLIEKEARMRRLLDEDISVMNLEYAASEFSEETEEDRDFSALVEQLQRNGQSVER